MIETIEHRIGEDITLIKEFTTELKLQIRRVSDGFYFNFTDEVFEEETVDNVIDFTTADYTLTLSALHDTGLATATITTIPDAVQDLLFVFDDVGTLSYERHLFGKPPTTETPETCLVYGTLRDVSGNALVGEQVKVSLLRSGYFVHKSGIVGHVANVITDSGGYFEIPLIHGLDVQITVPTIGYTQRGIVPAVNSVELNSTALLTHVP